MISKVIIHLPLLFVIICVPMALQLVPPNGIYGVRTPATLASSALWYTANFRAGVAGVAVGLVAMVVNVVAANSSSLTDAWKMAVVVGTTVLTTLAIIVAGVVGVD